MTNTNALPPGSRVLVTGAGGFVGGHVARDLSRAGYHVRALSRRTPETEPDDPAVEWLIGDLLNDEDRQAAVRGVAAVVHVASWVSLGTDRKDLSRRVNVEATRALLDHAERAGVGRFLYVSTLWTVAAGSREQPATESSAWNLSTLQSPYCVTKREAERLVRDRDQGRMQTCAICPGFVIGPRDVRPTSTGLFLMMARSPMAVLPGGGIPVIDARVLSLAIQRAMETGEAGARYIVAGPYLSYREMASEVRRLTGWPRVMLPVPDVFEPPLMAVARLGSLVLGRRAGDLTPAAVGGGFLRLHVSGARADERFGLTHPPPGDSIRDALLDHQRRGRRIRLRLTSS
jgi:dihydroflavonol-4-reductase